MAECQDTRSIYAPKKPDPWTEPEPRALVDPRALAKRGLFGLGRWMALVAAIALGTRAGLGWFAADVANEIAAQLDRAAAEMKRAFK